MSHQPASNVSPYFSGSTGQPKGVLHTTGGYMLYAATTYKYVFDYKVSAATVCRLNNTSGHRLPPPRVC